MSAEIISLCDRRALSQTFPDVDLRTAVDVAIRDLREIQDNWGSTTALRRLVECRELLDAAFTAS